MSALHWERDGAGKLLLQAPERHVFIQLAGDLARAEHPVARHIPAPWPPAKNQALDGVADEGGQEHGHDVARAKGRTVASRGNMEVPALALQRPGAYHSTPHQVDPIEVSAVDIGALLHDHIYTAIVLGSLVEGETTVVLAGYAAHRGYAPWWAVAALAAVVNFALDQAWYVLGRSRGAALLARFSALRRGVEAMTPRIERHRRWIIFSVRFMYGLRTAGPIALGITRVPWLDFVVFNALGAVAWATMFAGLGYAFGLAIAAVIGEIAHYEMLAVLVIVAGGLAGWLWHRHRRAAERA